MRMQMKITPLRAGTTEPADRPRLFPCPPDLEPDQIRSFLVQFFGEEPVDIARTKTERHERINIGWIFRSPPGAGAEPMDNFELLCVPVVDADDGSPKPLFEVLADQRQDFEQLAASGTLDSVMIIEAPLRDYGSARSETNQTGEESG